jgi:hypothetical protein
MVLRFPLLCLTESRVTTIAANADTDQLIEVNIEIDFSRLFEKIRS